MLVLARARVSPVSRPVCAFTRLARQPRYLQACVRHTSRRSTSTSTRRRCGSRCNNNNNNTAAATILGNSRTAQHWHLRDRIAQHRRWLSTQPEACSSPELLYADTSDALEKVVDMFQGQDTIAVDTEFSSFPSYDPQLQLIQLATDEERAACIDCLGMPPEALKAALRAILDDATVVLHSCTTDLLLVRRAVDDMAWQPRALFDTQVACNLVGVGNTIGLGPMLQELLHVKLDKSQSLTDWRLRPLSKRQLEYAMDDVHFLPKAAEVLQERLQELGRTEWMQEDMQRIAGATPLAADPTERWLSFRRLHQLRDAPRARAVLREIAAWRELDAQRRGVHPVTIISDDTLLSIAKAETDCLSALSTIQGVKWSLLHFAVQDLLAAIRRGLDCTHPPELPPHMALPMQQEAEMTLKSTLATAYLTQLAHDNSLSFSALLSWEERSLLGPWLMHTGVEDEQLTLTQGWRRAFCGDTLDAYRRGEIDLSLRTVPTPTTTAGA